MEALPPIRYEFFAPPRIVFGWGRRSEIGPLARSLGQRAFLVWGSRKLVAQGISHEVHQLLADNGVEPLDLAQISREPQVADVDRATADLKSHNLRHNDLLVAVGGGSAIDLAKAVAAMATNDGTSVKDYLEGVGRGLQLACPPLPVLAVPTTAGTGSEATMNAVISSSDPPFKKSLRSELMIPRIVLVDPELTVTVPPAVTAQTGMDAITQLIESYISRRAHPIPQALAIHGLKLAAPALAVAVADGTCRAARKAMAHAALLSGMALANSGLGMAHGVAAALGIHCGTPHGLACAVMLPLALRVNRPACETAFAELAAALGESAEDPATAADALVRHVDELCDAVGVPRRLSQIGVRPEQIPLLVQGSRGNSMDGNPRPISDDELTRILEEHL